jgi:hypothetical protein
MQIMSATPYGMLLGGSVIGGGLLLLLWGLAVIDWYIGLAIFAWFLT